MDTGTVTNRAAILRRSPVIPRTTGVAWRLAPLADRRRVDVFIRLFGAGALPIGANRGRLAAMGLPADVTEHALRRVRSVRDWDLAWTWAAQRFLGEARVHQRVWAARTRRRSPSNTRRLPTIWPGCWSSTTRARSGRSEPRRHRSTRDRCRCCDRPCAGSRCPGEPRIFRAIWPCRRTRLARRRSRSCSMERRRARKRRSSGATRSSSTVWPCWRWTGPGVAKAALHVPPTPDCDDFMEGVIAVASGEPAIDASRIGLVGFSLGGAVAALAAANDRRVGAVVAVTPPYDPRPWFARAQPLLRRHLATHRRWRGTARAAGRRVRVARDHRARRGARCS